VETVTPAPFAAISPDVSRRSHTKAQRTRAQPFRIVAPRSLFYLPASVERNRMSRSFSLFAALLALFAAAPASAGELTGLWLVQDRTAKVKIVPCGDAFCGSVVWLSEVNDRETGKPKLDKLNSNPQLRSRPIMGVPVLMSLQGSDGVKWSGRIYNPDDGNTYSGTVELVGATQLKVRACVTIFCRSEVWDRTD
jgi:uncharacterized protein (DUF2147 family)